MAPPYPHPILESRQPLRQPRGKSALDHGQLGRGCTLGSWNTAGCYGAELAQ